MKNLQFNSISQKSKNILNAVFISSAICFAVFPASPSRAAVVLWNLDNVVFGSGPITGTITADSTTNLVTAVDLVVADFGGTPQLFQLNGASPNVLSNSSNQIRIWSTTPNLTRLLSLKLAGTGTWGSDATAMALEYSAANNLRRSTGACCDYIQSGSLLRANAVPEPASWAMLIAGFGLVGAAARRRRTILA